MQQLSPEHLPLGDGRYVQLVRPIGRGSTATVYRAMMSGLGGVERPAAVKLYAPVASEDQEPVHASLRAIVQSGARVHHPNVVGAYDFAVFVRQAFSVHELVDGASLDALLGILGEKEQRLPLDIAVFIAVEVVEALHGARVGRDPTTGRSLGLVHLGLSPAEVLLSRHGEVKVSDFGASLARGASSGVRALDGVARRARFMSPEVARGEGGDERSDVFSVGVLMRELLLGPRFASGTSSSDVVTLARDGFVQPLTFQPQLPESLLAIVRRALEIDPDARFPNATALLFELRRAALALGVGDARFFLRRLLEREVRNAFEDTTVQTDVDAEPQAAEGEDAPVDESGATEVADADVLEEEPAPRDDESFGRTGEVPVLDIRRAMSRRRPPPRA